MSDDGEGLLVLLFFVCLWLLGLLGDCAGGRYRCGQCLSRNAPTECKSVGK